MTPAKLAAICEALGGPTTVARFLAINDRTIRYYLAGARVIPPATQRTLLARLYEQADNLTSLAKSVKLPPQPKPKGK